MLAYLDTFAGMVPCKIVNVRRHDDGTVRSLTVKLTATRGAYERGEVIPACSTLCCVPRHVLHYRNGCQRIWAYDWNKELDNAANGC